MEYTYEMIEPLIKSREVDGQMIKIKLQAKNQEQPLETVAVVMPDQDAIMKKAMAQAGKAAAVGAAANAASNMLGNAIGGVAGGLVSSGASAASSMASSKMINTQDILSASMDEESMQKAIVDAFKHMSLYYKFENGEWIYTTPGA